RQVPPVRTECDTVNRPRVAADHQHHPAGGGVPYPGEAVVAGGGQSPAVGAESHGTDAPTAVQAEPFLAGRDLPNADRPILAGPGQLTAAGMESHGVDGAAAAQAEPPPAGRDLPDADG